MNSRMFAKGSCLPLRSARRRATVTISAPLASSAARIISGDENLPVPRINRDRISCPAIVNGLLMCDIRGSIGGREASVERQDNRAVAQFNLARETRETHKNSNRTPFCSTCVSWESQREDWRRVVAGEETEY